MATPEYTAPSCMDRRRGLRSVPHRRKEPSMIYEIRTYRIAPGSLAEVEKRYAEAYEYRKKYSELTAFWHTEIGPLNESVHVWGYKDLAERARLRGEAAKDPNWPPKIREFVQAMRSEIIVPFSFVPEVRPGKLGPIYELRYYTLKPGPRRGEEEGRLAAAGRSRPVADAGEQDPAAGRILTAPVALRASKGDDDGAGLRTVRRRGAGDHPRGSAGGRRARVQLLLGEPSRFDRRPGGARPGGEGDPADRARHRRHSAPHPRAREHRPGRAGPRAAPRAAPPRRGQPESELAQTSA